MCRRVEGLRSKAVAALLRGPGKREGSGLEAASRDRKALGCAASFAGSSSPFPDHFLGPRPCQRSGPCKRGGGRVQPSSSAGKLPALSSEQDLPTVWDAAGLLPAGVGVP